MQIEQLTYTIAGLSPLLLNNPRGMLAQSSAAPSRQKRIPTPEEEAEGGTYRTAEGVLAVPAIAVRNAMITAAAGFKYKTRSWKGFVSHIEIRPAELLALYDSRERPVTMYEIDLRRAVIKGRGAVARPPTHPRLARLLHLRRGSGDAAARPPARPAPSVPPRRRGADRHRRLPAGEDRLVRPLHRPRMIDRLSRPGHARRCKARHGAASHGAARYPFVQG